MDDGPDQSLSLAQGQAEHGSQCQRRGNRQIGVGGLPAGGGAWRGAPGRDRRVREPDCETATLAQGGVILGPVGHPVPLLGNVAATGCLGFERHDRDPSVRKGAVVLRRPAPDANRSIRATMSTWSLISLREKLIKIGAKVVRHGRYVMFQLAEVAVPRQMFAAILSLIARLRAPPTPA